MAGINVTLREVATNTEHTVEIPRDIPMSRLIPALMARLELPITGPDGQQMSYRLQTEDGTVLQDNDTLNSVGVQDGATITLSSEQEAGDELYFGRR